MKIDSAGRTVELPVQIERIAPSGSLAQIALFAIAPERLAGVSGRWREKSAPYIDAKYRDLPVFGQFYGTKNFNKEAVVAARPDVIIDIGEKKAGIGAAPDVASRVLFEMRLPRIVVAMGEKARAPSRLRSILMTTHAPAHAFYACRNTAVLCRAPSGKAQLLLGKTEDMVTARYLAEAYHVRARIVTLAETPRAAAPVVLPPEADTPHGI